MENTNDIKTLSITIPEGYEIDKNKSTFKTIIFKKKETKLWKEEKHLVKGYYIDKDSNLKPTGYVSWIPINFNIFATKKQAKSALAMAKISQIMANDERFGGSISDEEWKETANIKYVIIRDNEGISKVTWCCTYTFLAFHTSKQRELFLKENEDLVKEFLML